MSATPLPRLGFLGLGWIGRMRMESVVRCGAARVASVADTAEERLEALGAGVSDASRHCGPDCLDALLAERPDGVVIATPSALHARQATRVLEAGIPVFCQKPLGRSAAETGDVVEAARRADRLLGVDFSYRRVRGARRMRELVRRGEIGEVFAANLVFHNAYGPDKPWFYDAHQSGGGCLIDLGVHLVDLALWTLGFPPVTDASGRLYRDGHPLRHRAERDAVESFASARIDVAGGASVSVSCSWNLSAGCDAVIEASFYGTRGTLSLRNVDGSFYDFRTEWFKGREVHLLDAPPDDWGGRGLVAWARRLRSSPRFDPRVEEVVRVAEVLDRIYAGGGEAENAAGAEAGISAGVRSRAAAAGAEMAGAETASAANNGAGARSRAGAGASAAAGVGPERSP